jgi:4-amino-4-deoxy-L-arabinose transferase-like glycosyltransferase
MTATSLVEPAAATRPTPAASSVPWWRSLTRPRPELLFLLLLAGVLNLWGLAENGWANEYYSAAVRSMSSSWHAFLYGSFDASGAMTVDKPPLSSWVQVAFVKVFGFHSLSLLVPQALMGVATVALVYDLTRRLWGRPAGFVAGLALATTPIAVAISRHNNPDALLILCCAGALWATVRALQDGRTRWIVLAGVCVGLGFEAKMAAALLIVPGIVAAWLWVAPRGRLVALRQLLAGGAAMVAVGGAWPLLVALTPAADRPWVSGTSDNSIFSLIFGYNGLGRLSGQAGGPQAFGGGAGGAGGGPFGGPTGVLRLLDASLGGQAGWLLGFALVSGLGIAIATRLRRADARTGWIIAVGGAALTCAVAFSAASGIFHPYYVSQLAPFAAALVGAGAGQMLKGDLRARILAALAIAGGVATTLVVLHNNPGQLQWLPPLLITVAVLAIGALALLGGRHLKTSLAVGLAVLFIAPAAWAGQTLGHATNGTFPAGGPTSAAAGGFGGGGAGGPGPRGGFTRRRGTPPAGFGGPPPRAGAIPGAGGGATGTAPNAGGRGGPGGGGLGGGDSQSITKALAYIKAHGGGTLAVSSQNGGAATSIINSGADVVAIGGFSGRESQVTTAWLASRVESGAIRWVLTTGGGGGGGNDNRVGSSDVMTAVANTGRPVSSVSGLYDLAGMGAALGS